MPRVACRTIQVAASHRYGVVRSKDNSARKTRIDQVEYYRKESIKGHKANKAREAPALG